MLLMTPVFSPQLPVRMVDQDGLEMVVCPTILVGAVELVLIRLKKLTLAGSASTRLRLVPSTPMTNTFGVSTAAMPTCGPLVTLRRKVLRSSSSRTAASAANAAGASTGG